MVKSLKTKTNRQSTPIPSIMYGYTLFDIGQCQKVE